VTIDFARHNQLITDFNPEGRTIRVGAGVVLDQLNRFLSPHGLSFGPDVATSSRATLGGMIANNSSGARTPIYGTTADHVISLEIVLADGRIETISAGHEALGPQRQLAQELVSRCSRQLDERMPPGLSKRWPGYGLDRWRRKPGNLCDLLAGSEGTLAGIWSAELSLVSLPQQKGLGIICFASMAEAMQATVELLDLQPAAIEHLDRVLFDQTRGQSQFQAARDLLGVDTLPCESMLIVEFYEQDSPPGMPGAGAFSSVAERLALLEGRALGLRTMILKGSAEMNLVWGLRKAGLSLLTSRKGPAKPVTGIEDVAVSPRQLPEYVAALRGIMRSLGLEACYYGHAAAGLLHVRPVLDLHRPEDVRRLRQVSDEVSALVRQFKGSLSAEHGVGIARTEYLRDHLGVELHDAFKEIKVSFDPKGLFNPGKIIADGRYKIDRNLRVDPGRALQLPFAPMLAFAARDESFIGNLEQCNGCGGCRKESPTMCPTFQATGEELMSTRGRANIIRAVLEGRGLGRVDALASTELESALSNCLACKACTTECPSNVNMSLLKAELLFARQKQSGLRLCERVLGGVDLLGQLGCLAPTLANAVLQWPLARNVLRRLLGISAQRQLPLYADQRFDHWFNQRGHSAEGRRGRVILWDDTFVRYHEPQVGKAAVALLEAAGFKVTLAHGRKCCGRPAFSQGNLEKARRLGEHNVRLLMEETTALGKAASFGWTELRSTPVLFLEPSCYSMFVEDYRELGIPGAELVAERCFPFEHFLENLLSHEPEALRFNSGTRRVALHVHCHAKALAKPAYMIDLARRLPGCDVRYLDTGCCGMAGAFGAMEAKLELSRKVAEPLVEKIQAQPDGTVVIASGTSCRHQIAHFTLAQPRHMAEVLAQALASNGQ
jgi:FAD/FMN-containing dehydrogenase/Fe-S oxidoreductase